MDEAVARRLTDLLRTAVSMQHADFGDIQRFDPKTRALHLIAAQGFEPAFLEHFKVVRDESTACGRAVRHGVCVIEDVQEDAAFAPHRAIAAEAGFRAVHSAAIVSPAGGTLGVMSVHFREPQRRAQRKGHAAALWARLAAEILDDRVGGEAQVTQAAERIAAAELQERFTSEALTLPAEERRWHGELSTELRRATASYVRMMRDDSCAPEVMLTRLKLLLRPDGRHANPALVHRLAATVVSHAILSYYAEGEAQAAATQLPFSPERRGTMPRSG